MRVATALAAVALVLSSCGGGDEAAQETTTTTSTTAPPEEDATLYLRFVAETSDLSGCSTSTDRAPIEVGNGARVQVSDGGGEILGTGTMQLTGGADSCDWTVLLGDMPGERDFYVVEAGGEAGPVP